MNHEYIKHTTLKIFKDCSIYSFPIDCFDILDHYQISVYPYSSLSDSLREHCLRYSDDALNYKGKLCYNDMMYETRIRFTLMHELGHIVLQHGESPSEEQEKEADFFSSHLLAPRMAIHYAGCKNQNDVAKLFQLSQEAAQYTFDDYRRWYRRTVTHKMTPYDKAMYNYFYNSVQDCFVYSVKRCEDCGTELYNSGHTLCNKCKSSITPLMLYQSPSEELLIAENHWLYGGL